MDNKKIPDKTEQYHTMPIKDVWQHFHTDSGGLSGSEAAKRLQQYGKNELQEGKKKSLPEMFLLQFKDVMIIILLAAAVISGFLGEFADTVIIALVVMINAILGVSQESKAEKALAALKQMSSPQARVLRNGEIQALATAEIVPGDIIFVEAGDYIPADVRLIVAASLKVEEAALTGESVPVEKTTSPIEQPDIVIGDRVNMAYLGTSVTYGRGNGVVVTTGMNTEVGKIAAQLDTQTAEATPLQKKLTELGKYISIAVITIAIVIFFAGVMQNRDTLEMFLTAVSLAVAAIPEGMPAIVTIVLALGVQKLARNNAIIRKLSAVETLGSTEIICSDKTGTLTLNKMTVQEIYAGGKAFAADAPLSADGPGESFMQAMVLCNDSIISQSEDGITETLGDPTETALVDFAAGQGFPKLELEAAMPRIGEIPFNSERKLMTTINRVKGSNRAFIKGAPDVLLKKCSQVLIDGQVIDMQAEIAAAINQANHDMASKALRILALAYKDNPPNYTNPEIAETEEGLTFLGLVGMIDPPRREVQEAVKKCRQAGIKPIMITGDHKDTAGAIARQLEILSNNDEVLTGSELDKIDDREFQRQVSKYSVYARVSPEHKVKIVNAWKQNGKVVAMTGDGVNDAPALKAADIGIGMGITGTDVAKGVSDIVLTDDNFATIVLAVEAGRKIYNNIRKAIQFLLSANIGEVLTLLVATMLNWPILSPIHILWINLVTDTFPALALGLEEGENDLMQQKPRRARASVFAEGVGTNIIYQGILQALLTLAAYYIGLNYYSHGIAVTMAFATLALIQLAHAYNVRSRTHSILAMGLFTNKYLLGATLISGILVVGVILIPAISKYFRVEALSLEQWLIVLGLAISIIPGVELVKFSTNLYKKGT